MTNDVTSDVGVDVGVDGDRPAPESGGRMHAHRWPTFLVTAPHEIVCSFGAAHARVPYGKWHARQVGSLQSVCGRPAVTWRFFWTLDFRDAGPRACPACREALRAQAG